MMRIEGDTMNNVESREQTELMLGSHKGSMKSFRGRDR
jgi:hypothetical protein